MRNAVPGFKSELKVTQCPPDSQKRPGSRKDSCWAPVENSYNYVVNNCKPIAS